MIIFLTDGQPNDAASDIMQTIKSKNAELNNAVVIMTYGMLKDLQILRDIAKQDGSNYGVSKAPDVTVSTITAMHGSHISIQCITAPFNIMRALKLKAQPTKPFFTTVNQIFGGSDYCRTRGNEIAEHTPDNETVFGSSRKLGGAVKHLIEDTGKRLCRLSFELYIPHVIERRSNT